MSTRQKHWVCALGRRKAKERQGAVTPGSSSTIGDPRARCVSQDGGGAGTEAFVCKRSGKIYYHFEFDPDLEEPLPDDIEDQTKYVPVPSKRALDLGTPLVFAFVREFLPDDYDSVGIGEKAVRAEGMIGIPLLTLPIAAHVMDRPH